MQSESARVPPCPECPGIRGSQEQDFCTAEKQARMHASSDIPAGSAVCEVRQTHDHCLVQSTFAGMGLEARDFLWQQLQLDLKYESAELPEAHSFTGQDFLWHELLAAAHQSGGRFFVVSELNGNELEPTFVSADWQSAQAWARTRTAQCLPVANGTPAAFPQPAAPMPMKKPPAVAAAARD